MTDCSPETGNRRRRRIVKRTAWTVAGIVLLLVLYVGGFGVTQWYLGSLLRVQEPYGGQHVLKVMVWADDTFYAPLNAYADSEWRGARSVRHYQIWCFCNGMEDTYVSWDDVNPDGFGGVGFAAGGGGFF